MLEAGPTFMQKNSDSDKYFSLLAEVENSAPPRLRMLIPALGMLFQNSVLLPFFYYPGLLNMTWVVCLLKCLLLP